MNNILPFTAIVGMELVKKSLIYHAIDPKLGGILLMGHRGCAKSTIARSFIDLLPVKNNYENPFVEVPLGTTEDRLLGSIDASRLLKNGEWSSKIGLIQQADGGVLYIDEVNLLQDHLVDSLLDSSSSGQHRIEREGISEKVSARYILIGSMNPDEGDLRPQLLDRFTHGILVRDEFSPLQRKEIVRTRMDFDDNPELFFARHKEKIDELKKQIIESRKKLKNVEISENVRNKVSEEASLLNLEGVRAELGVLRTVRCAAAYRGDKEVSEEDIEEAWELCLGHRKEDINNKKKDITPEKDFSENIHDEKDKGALENQKTSIFPMTARKDKIVLRHTKNIENIELTRWWFLSDKKIKKLLNPFATRKSTLVPENVSLSRISWSSSLHASVLNGWTPGKPWHLRYSKEMRRNNFWIFLDASRSTGIVNFLGKARDAINKLGSKTFYSRFYVLVLHNGDTSWWLKRGTFQTFKKSMEKLNEASGKSNLFLAFEKLNNAVKKNGFLKGDKVLICSDGMFSKESKRSINDSKKRFQILLRSLSEKVNNLGWLHPKLQRGMLQWLPKLTQGIDVHLISLDSHESRIK